MLATSLCRTGRHSKIHLVSVHGAGEPTALSTSAAFPLTVTSMGELTVGQGTRRKGLPRIDSRARGPRPGANIDRISPP